jgi:hypothetical protein
LHLIPNTFLFLLIYSHIFFISFISIPSLGYSLQLILIYHKCIVLCFAVV